MSPIVDPYILLEQPKPLPEHWALVDAFDAVTNGMDNPEALERIRVLDHTELASWKWLVFTIKALYEGNAEAVELAVQYLEDGTPPAVLKPLFFTWLSEHLHGKAVFLNQPELADLYTTLRIHQHPLVSRAEQTEEALQQGLIPLFEHQFEKTLHALYSIHPNEGPGLAIRYGVHTLCMLHEMGCRLEDFLTLLVQALGEADGCCCLALAFIKLQEAHPPLQDRTLKAIDACLAAKEGRFANADMKKTLGIIKTGFDALDRIQRKQKVYREPVQMELF
uniref:Uncharacterized protein n=1 Tax=Gracilinema caldarium TaxID=215591 RepID=A0A7C3IFE8_9SPIR